MKTEFQSIKGQLDSSQYLNKESQSVYQDLDMRVSSLEDKIGQIQTMLKELKVATSASSTTGPTASPKGAAVNPIAKMSAEYDEFQGLLNMVNAQDYRNAASGFMGFIKKYPKSEYLGSAQFWLGESYYSMGDYAKSIAEYQSLVEKYPQHPRAKEAVYKQGLAFMRMKKYPEAKLFFQKVESSYPNSTEAFEAQARLHRIEELEGTNMALGNSTESAPSKPPPGPGEPVYNRPISKPNPYPGAYPGNQPGSNPPSPGTTGIKPIVTPTPEAPPKPPAPEPTGRTSGDGSAPLF